jgi:peptidoglycan L-alanyl-D-glutamate endopeptidase CwlK
MNSVYYGGPFPYGVGSKNIILGCKQPLRMVLEEAAKYRDIQAIYSLRGKILQNQLFAQGLSEKQWPNSQHNNPNLVEVPADFSTLMEDQKSNAVDIAPYFDNLSPHVDWSDDVLAQAQFYMLAGMIFAIANQLGVKLRWGGDWNSDGSFKDQKFHDLGHFELAQ